MDAHAHDKAAASAGGWQPRWTDEDIAICLHEGDDPDRFRGAVIPPLFGNSLFVYPSHEALSAALADQRGHYVYWRGRNPTVEAAERKLAALERGEACICFASGMAAIAAALLSSLRSGDHALLVGNVYESTAQLLVYLGKFGVAYDVVLGTSPSDIAAAMRPETKAVYLETPSTLTFRVTDIAAAAATVRARSRGIRIIADNTWATPLYQKPLTLGADIVVHSASKYLGGHSDLVAGALIADRATVQSIFDSEYLLIGAVMPPHAASLLLRGLRTLPVRLAQTQANALRVAEALQAHPAVAAVHYPGLPEHPDYRVAAAQMGGFTGLLAFELKEAAFGPVKTVINNLKTVQVGVSFGSFESLAMSPNYGSNEERLAREGISPGTIRLSVGLEPPETIIADLMRALDAVGSASAT